MKKANILLLSLFVIILGAILIIRANRRDMWHFKSGETTEARGAVPENIVLITIDTLRVDHLSCYGYEKNTSPNMDKLADKGALFLKATCQVPITLPSHTSILTGALPVYHQVRLNAEDVLADEHVTLAETLKAEGFSTGAFVSAIVLESQFGLGQGFDTYDEDFTGSILTQTRWQLGREIFHIKEDASFERRADETTQAAIQWVRENRDQKFFLWIHYYDPHAPYYSYDETGSEIVDQGGLDVATGIVHYGILEKSLRYYDDEITLTDLWIGRLVDVLDELELTGKTVIVITADHGEGFGEKGDLYEHVFLLYETVTHVPLIIVDPAMRHKGVKIAERVQTIDIFPTVCELLGVQTPQTVQGASLAPLLRKERGWKPVPAYSETHNPKKLNKSELYALLGDNWKLIWAPQRGGYSLYDLDEDPGEENNLVAISQSRPDFFEKKYLPVLRDMDSQLKEVLATKVGTLPEVKKEVDESTRRKLRSLGYVD